jgi:integrase/recombinase XerD
MYGNGVEQLTISKLIDEFITDKKSNNLSPKTILFYNQELKPFQQYLDTFEVSRIGDITPDIIRKYLLSVGTHRKNIHPSYRTIKVFLRWFEEQYEPSGWKNPITKIHVKAPKIQPKQGVSLQDVSKLIASCTGRFACRDKSIFMVMLDSCLRASELTNLNIENVDLVNGCITVFHGKGDRGRLVFLGMESKKMLRKYLRSRGDIQPTDPLFTNEDDNRLRFFGLRQMVIRRSKVASLNKVPGLHDFRRAGAINLLRSGVSVAVIQKILGHSSISTTQVYLAINDNDTKKAIINNSVTDSLFV